MIIFNNRVIDITGDGRYDEFMKALSFFFDDKKVYYYAITKQYGLIVFWVNNISNVTIKDGDNEVDVQALPYPMDLEAISIFVWNWLKQVEYPDQPGHDGSNKKGWRVYNEAWSHVADCPYALVAIKPIWAMYGK